MALYKDGNPVSGLNSIPRLTLAQYNAQNAKPEFWVRTDAPESYKKLSADQVSYDSSNTVKDKIDELEDGIENVLFGADDDLFINSDIVFTDTETDICGTTKYLEAGEYLIFGSVNASWTNDGYQCGFFLSVDNDRKTAYSSAKSQTNTPCFFSETFTISNDGNHQVKLTGQTSIYSKEVTVHAFQTVNFIILRVGN